jgi:hypothetical protein
MKAKLIFIIAVVLFVTLGFLKLEKVFYLAASIEAFFLCIYFLFDAIKKPISVRLGIFHASMSFIGLLLLAFCVPHFTPQASYGNMDANSFVADIKIIFKLVTGFLLFASAQILFLLSISKKIK